MLGGLTIRQKTLLLFALVSLLPLLVINVIWLRSSQNQLKQAAAARQSILVSASAERVNQFIRAKIDNAIIHSQINSVREFDIGRARLNLLEYAKQDGELLRIALVDKTGQEQIALERLKFSKQLNNVKNSDAFRVVTFLSGKEYIGPVSYDKGQPQVVLAVPLISFTNRQGGIDLSTAESGIRRGSGDIKGALIVNVSLNNLWQTVLSAKLGDTGYAYLIDDKGNLIAYPESQFISEHQNLRGVREVDEAISHLTAGTINESSEPAPRATTSEKGVAVLSSYQLVPRTHWAVIGEEPISSVYAQANRASKIAVIIFVASAIVASGLILISSGGVVNPIRQLTGEAVRLGSGDFSRQIKVVSHDELGTLAQTFNQMGASLQDLVRRLRLRNIDLSAERTKLKAVLNTITDGVLALNQDFSIALANATAAKLLGQAPEQLQHRPWLEVFKLRYQNEPFKNGWLGGKTFYFKDVELATGASPKYLDLSVVKLSEDPSGISYILTVHDTTQSRELEIMRLDFVSMAAHELRTPLTAVSGYLHLLANNRGLDDEDARYLKRAQANTTNLESLITNLLSLSRIERGALVLKPDKLDWDKTVISEVKNQQLSASDKQIEIKYQPAPQPIWLLGDELALREVLANLLSNAIHYTKAGGRISVKVTQSKKAVTTAVSDNGIGIPLEAQAKLFTKYYRVESGLTSGSQGTGIGLFVCKTIVEAHQGTVGVDSAPGKGSTFSFSLPPFDEARYRQVAKSSGNMQPRSRVGWITKSSTS